jgi:hypothetical protein
MAVPVPLGGRVAAPKHLERHRVVLADGATTTVHVAAYRLDRTELRVVRMRRPLPLETWCEREGVEEAIVGGFFVRGGRDDDRPLGELRMRGMARRTVPFDAPHGALRACVHAHGAGVHIARRDDLPTAPAGDLLQAGPLLVAGGAVAAGLDADAEGFSAGRRQFDSDITAGRYPRAAIAVDGRRILAVACDGRAGDEAGLDLVELAELLVGLGAREAMNLDGGGSTSLVCGGRLRNVPREGHGIVLHGGRPVPTALAFLPR